LYYNLFNLGCRTMVYRLHVVKAVASGSTSLAMTGQTKSPASRKETGILQSLFAGSVISRNCSLVHPDISRARTRLAKIRIYKLCEWLVLSSRHMHRGK
jgi:hypothetical protein